MVSIVYVEITLSIDHRPEFVLSLFGHLLRKADALEYRLLLRAEGKEVISFALDLPGCWLIWSSDEILKLERRVLEEPLLVAIVFDRTVNTRQVLTELLYDFSIHRSINSGLPGCQLFLKSRI